MSITTHQTTIRQWVKNHTKDEIAVFVEDQLNSRDREIERLKHEILIQAGNALSVRNACKEAGFDPYFRPSGIPRDLVDPVKDMIAEIERLKEGIWRLRWPTITTNDATAHLWIEKDAEIERLKARIEFLEKGMEQAVKIGRVGFPGYYGEGAKWMYDYDKLENDACGITSYKCADHPELAAWLKEKENGV